MHLYVVPCPSPLSFSSSSISGVASTRLDVCLDLFHSLSLLASIPKTSPYPYPMASRDTSTIGVKGAAMELAEILALKVKELEATQLHTVALSMGKLRIDDVNVTCRERP